MNTYFEAGRVLDDEKSLMDLLEGDDLVKYVNVHQKEGGTTARIVISGG